MLFLASAVASGTVCARGAVSGAVSHPNSNLCCFFLPHPASLVLFCTPAVISGAFLLFYPSWCIWCSFIPLSLFLAPAGVLCAVSCPLYRLWCCFQPHISPLVLFLTQTVTTVTRILVPCCRLPKLSPSALFLTPSLTPAMFLTQPFASVAVHTPSCHKLCSLLPQLSPQVLFLAQVERPLLLFLSSAPSGAVF